MTRPFLLAALLQLAAIPAAAQTAFDPAARAAIVAPFLDEQTLAVGRINFAKVDPAAAVKLLADVSGDKRPETAQQFAALEQQAKARLHVLAQSGFRELYAVLSLADMPKEPLMIVAPVKAGDDAQKAAEALRELLGFEAADARGGAVVVSSQRIIDRLKMMQPTPRPQIAKGFERAGDTAIQLVFAPSSDTRRVLREMLPRLPEEIGGGSGKTLADGLEWAVVSVDLPPRLSLSVTIQSKDAESASALRALAVSGLALLREDRGMQQIPQLDEVIRTLTPKLMGDRLIVTADEQGGTARTLLNILTPAVQAARTAAGRNQSINNLKQIALAAHMYHDTHNRLPPQAIRSKDGKPLLSWRVALLPYLDASPLHKEFRMDEPWDSEHNKKLIEKMPPVFASPHLGDMRKAQGLTSYLAPLTRQPPAMFVPPAPGAAPPAAEKTPLTIFDEPAGATFRQITDGTSNTILILEAHPNSAVPWTKPDDLVIDAQDLAAKLRGQPDNAFAAALADGSVRMIKLTVDPQTLLRLLQMNDGQPVGEF